MPGRDAYLDGLLGIAQPDRRDGRALAEFRNREALCALFQRWILIGNWRARPRSSAGRDLSLRRWPHIRGHFYFV